MSAARDILVGSVAIDWHTVLDVNDAPLTGITIAGGGVAVDLFRQSGSTMIAAAEAVTWTEIGVTGDYYFTFTPLNTGLYVAHVRELDPLSGQAQREYRFNSLSAGATFSPTYANAFCAETDIERYLGFAITAATSPNDTETTAWAEEIADILESLTARLGYAVTPSTVTAGSQLAGLLRAANAIGAALYFTIAKELAVSPDESARVERFRALWIDYVGGPQPGFVTEKKGLIELLIHGSLASLSRDQITSGDTYEDPGASAVVYNLPIGIGMGDTY